MNIITVYGRKVVDTLLETEIGCLLPLYPDKRYEVGLDCFYMLERVEYRYRILRILVI